MIRIIKKASNAFVCEDDDLFGNCLALTGDWNSKCASLVKKYDVKVLRLSASNGWISDVVDFYGDIPLSVEGVEIYSLKVSDLSFLKTFPNLRYVGLEVAPESVLPDLSGKDSLREVFLSRWYEGAEMLLQCSRIESLNLSGLPYTGLGAFSSMASLKSLRLFDCDSLKEIESLGCAEKLRLLELCGCSSLQDINIVGRLKALDCVEVTSCRNISELPNFDDGHAVSRISLNNCEGIKSMLPLQSCRGLQGLFFVESTNVEDGKLRDVVLANNMRQCAFANRQHYDIKIQEVRKAMAARS